MDEDLRLRLAAAEILIFLAITLQDFIEWNGVVFAFANAFQRTLGHIQTLKILQVSQDCLAGIETLGAPSASGKFLKPFFDGLREPDSQHLRLAK
jgi:hypothetical protein